MGAFVDMDPSVMKNHLPDVKIKLFSVLWGHNQLFLLVSQKQKMERACTFNVLAHYFVTDGVRMMISSDLINHLI